MQIEAELDIIRTHYVPEYETFDYTEWRRTNLPDDDIEELNRKAVEYTRTLNRR